MRSQAKKKEAVEPEAPRGRPVRCRCGRVGVLVGRDRLTIYEAEDEPWTSSMEGAAEVTVACEECSWKAVFTWEGTAYRVQVTTGKKAVQMVREEMGSDDEL